MCVSPKSNGEQHKIKCILFAGVYVFIARGDLFSFAPLKARVSDYDLAMNEELSKNC